MPNHITNIVVVSGDNSQRQAMFEAIKNDEFGLGSVDFNKVIPMPESLNIECGSRTDRAMKLYKDFCDESTTLALANVLNPNMAMASGGTHEDAVTELIRKYEAITKDDPGLLELGEQCYNNLRKHGATTWYDWSVANWGTKWNSYGYHDHTQKDFDGATLTFDTAWSNPRPIIAALAQKYHDLDFSHKWADEDLGYNVGEKEYTNGVESFSNVPEGGSKEALELAAEIKGLNLADVGYIFDEKTGQYEYSDPEMPRLLQFQ